LALYLYYVCVVYLYYSCVVLYIVLLRLVSYSAVIQQVLWIYKTNMYICMYCMYVCTYVNKKYSTYRKQWRKKSCTQSFGEKTWRKDTKWKMQGLLGW